MTPDARNYNPDPANARALIERIQATGKPQRRIAERLGISERRVRYLIAGSRIVNGETLAVAMSHTEQFELECLAGAAEIMKLEKSARRKNPSNFYCLPGRAVGFTS